MARPRRPQCTEQAAPSPASPAATGLTEDPAALARAPRCTPLDLPAPSTRPTTHITADPGAGVADGAGKSQLGLQKDSGRAGRTRPFDRRIDGVGDLEGRGSRSRPTTVRAYLATVPHRSGSRAPRGRLRPRRYPIPAPSLHPDRDRAQASPRAHCRDHRPSHGAMGHSTSPQPAHGPRRPRGPIPVLDPRPGQQVHGSLLRSLRRCRHPHHPHPDPGTPRERDRRTVHRHAAPRMPRPPPDHRTSPPRRSAARVCPALRRAPASPIAASATTRRRHSPRSRAAISPLRRDRLGGLIHEYVQVA